MSSLRQETLVTEIATLIQTHQPPLVLVVAEDTRLFAKIAHILLQKIPTARTLDVSTLLSKQVVENHVLLVASRLKTQILSAFPENAPVMLLTGIDLLFEPTLHLDPLTLLQQISRSQPLVVCWPGQWTPSGLSYAVPKHAHYRVWRNVDSETPIFPVQ